MRRAGVPRPSIMAAGRNAASACARAFLSAGRLGPACVGGRARMIDAAGDACLRATTPRRGGPRSFSKLFRGWGAGFSLRNPPVDRARPRRRARHVDAARAAPVIDARRRRTIRAAGTLHVTRARAIAWIENGAAGGPSIAQLSPAARTIGRRRTAEGAGGPIT